VIEVIVREEGEVELRCQVLANRLSAMWDFSVPAQISVRPYQDKRTRAQNRLYWKWLGIIAEELRTVKQTATKDDFHDMLRHKYLGTEEVSIAGTVVTRLPSTTRLQRGEMAQYMHRVEQWAADMGVLLPIPSDNEYLKYREAMQ
jgi:hypothetical protein